MSLDGTWLERSWGEVKNLAVLLKKFYCELVKLGGLLGLDGDGYPGWVTIWHGWEKLNALVRGAELAAQMAGCG